MADENKKMSLGKKVAIGIAFTAVVIGTSMFFSPSKTEQEQGGNVRISADNPDTGNPLDSQSEEYASEVSKRNAADEKEALNNGTSHIDTMLNVKEKEPSIDMLKDDASASEPQAIDKIYESQQASQPGVEQAVNQMPQTQYYEKTIIKEVPVPSVEKYDYKKDTSLIGFLNSQEGPRVFAHVSTHGDMYRAKVAEEKRVQAEAQANKQQEKEQQGKTPVAEGTVVLQKAGDLVPIDLQTSIDSQKPSIVRAVIVTGKLSGAVLTGSFAQDNKSVNITFNKISIPGVDNSIPINAVAVDYNTASTALSTSVNNYTWQKILATSISSLGRAWADILKTNNITSHSENSNNSWGNSSSTTTTSVPKTNKQIWREAGADAVGAATNEIHGLIPAQPRVRVKAEQVQAGIYFTEDFALPKDVADKIER